VRPAARQAIDEFAADLPAEQRRQLTDWLTQAPAVLRRSLKRPEDHSGRTLPGGFDTYGPADLARLLPSRPPRFKQGDRPLPGVDLELEELLGVGGFGEVWKARNPHLASAAPVALKFCVDAQARQQLLKHETAMLDAVMRKGRHPGIVPLLRTYLSADPPCLEYEFVEASDLGALAQEWHHKGRATPERINRLMLALSGIVAFAHQKGIVHRDLKPANILVEHPRDGKARLRVTDFGIGGNARRLAPTTQRWREGRTRRCTPVRNRNEGIRRTRAMTCIRWASSGISC
jgi:serine/threonine protein kinase